MKKDPEFAAEVQQLAQQITQIEELNGEVFNVFGGVVNFVKNPTAPVIQGDGNTININN